MKRLAILPALLLPVVASAACSSSTAPMATLQAAHGKAAPGTYIVTVKSMGTDAMDQTMGDMPDGAVTHVYHNVMHGFSAKLSESQLSKLRRDPNVAKVAEATMMHVDTTQANPDWGLDRLDSDQLDQQYSYQHTGKGVTAYVIDTGIDTGNADFGGRASVAFDATGGNGQDQNGHGTHVAGTIGGTEFGVAKDVTLKAVRVLDANGQGTDADVVAGMDWVTQHAQKPAVANMSLGGAKDATIDQAAVNMANAGVFLAVAAGNESTDACTESPSGADGIFTVAASDKTDASADFTNFGKCVEIYAPGVDITSDWLNGGTNTISGTSMATPHVVGVAALYKEANGDASEQTISSWLANNAGREGVISGVPAGTPNVLLSTGGL